MFSISRKRIAKEWTHTSDFWRSEWRNERTPDKTEEGERVKLVVVFTQKWHRLGRLVNGRESIINGLDVIALPRLPYHRHATHTSFLTD